MKNKDFLQRKAPASSWMKIKDKNKFKGSKNCMSEWKNKDICDNMLAKLLAHEIWIGIDL